MKFFKSIRDVRCGKDICPRFSDLIKSYETHEDYCAEGGQYLPLAVWEKTRVRLPAGPPFQARGSAAPEGSRGRARHRRAAIRRS
eukprot:8931405-Pyramimonas_sp.AAC.1